MTPNLTEIDRDAAILGVASLLLLGAVSIGKKAVQAGAVGLITRLWKSVFPGKVDTKAIEAAGEMFKVLSESIAGLKSQLDKMDSEGMRDSIARMEVMLHHMRVSQELSNDSSGMLIWRADTQGRVVWVSKACKQRIGAVDDSELLGWSWLNIVHPEDRERVRNRFLQAIKDRSEAHDSFRCVMIQSGLSINVNSFIKPVWIGDDIAGWQGVLTITSYEKRSEK